MPAVGEIFAQRYLLTALIGQRDTGEVYRAEDAALGRPVAIKILSPELAREGDFLRRFRSETQAAARLSHTNIVSYYDWGTEAGHPFVVSELCLGGSLRDIIDSGAKLSVAQAVQVGLGVAEGLKHAHDQGLIHGGIAPSNILFDAAGRPKITDFALAVLHAGTTLPSFHDRIFGPTFYAAPEEIENSELTEKADVYALALVLVEAVLGAYPFVGETTLSVLWERLVTPLPTPPELLGLAEPIAQASAMQPAERLTTEEFADQLSQLAETMPEPERLALVSLPEPVVDSRAASQVAADGSPAWQLPAEAGAEVGAGVGAGTSAGVGGSPGIGAGVGRGAGSGVAGAPRGSFWRRVRQLRAGPALVPGQPAQRPPQRRVSARELWVSVAAVGLIVIAGVVGFAVFSGEAANQRTLPDYVGQTWDDALDDINGKWLVRRYELRRDETSEGQILAQQPEAGEKLAVGEQVTLTVSLGDELVRLPGDLIGLPMDVVALRLSELGLLVGEVTEIDDANSSPNIVLGISEPLLDVVTGSQIALLVSSGPAQIAVPDNLLGANFEDVEPDLVELGFEVVQQLVHHDQTEAGTILFVTPEVNTLVAAGSELTLTISEGPKLVPDLKGLALGEARELLENEGFCLESQTIDGTSLDSYDDSDLVSNSLPPAGQPVPLLETEADTDAGTSDPADPAEPTATTAPADANDPDDPEVSGDPADTSEDPASDPPPRACVRLLME